MRPKKNQQEDAQQSLGIKLEDFLNMDCTNRVEGGLPHTAI